MESNYWGRGTRRALNRRRFLGTAGTLAAGGAALSLVSCSGSNNNSGNKGSAATKAAATAATGVSGTSAAATVAAAKPSAAANIHKGGTLQIATSVGDPPKLDPHSLLNQGVWDINSIYLEKLIDFDSTGTTDVSRTQLVPGLAEKWEQPDPMTAVLHLTNAAWHDKTPVNGRAFGSNDVKATMDRILDPANKLPAGGLIVDFVDKVTATDPRTVTFSLKRPFGALFEVLGAGAFLVIIPEEGAKGAYDLEQTQIGTGSFILKSHKAGDRNTYDANRKFRKPVNLDGIEQIAFSDQNALTAAVLSGKLHITVMAEGTDPNIVPKSTYNVFIVPGNIRYELAINRRFKPFDDLRVRQAMRLLVDQDEILKKAFNSQASFLGIIPASSAWALPEAKNRELFKPDPAQAKQLLSAAGFTSYDGSFVHYDSGAQVPTLRASGEILAAQMASAGFKMQVKAGELATVLKEQYAGDYVTNVRPNAGNTGNGLYDWTYKSEHTNGLFSVHNTANMPPDPKLNDLCLRAVASSNKAEQDAINAEFQQYLHDMAYWVPLGCPTHVLAAHKDVQGWGYHTSDTQIVQSSFAADYWLRG